MAAVLLYVCSAFVVWVCSALFPPVQASCGSLGNSVDCSKAGLLNIPKDLATWVTRLELQSNGITEIRPDDLKGLKDLKYLDLSKNALSMVDWSVFRDLVNLEVLILDSNQLTEVPRFPIAMNITTLSMAENHLVTIPLEAIQQMPQLDRLDLSSNNLLSIVNGSFPAKCKLRYLNLNGNKIWAIDQGSLNNLTILETLKLNRNKLTDLPLAVFSQLAKLKTLELVKNDLRMITGLTFQGLKELQTLKLKRNRISVLKDGAFYGLSSITSLYLDNNKIGNITKAWLFGLKTLKHLSLSHNRIVSIEREAWESCPHLDKLDLNYNRLTAITDRSLAHLSQLRQLYMDHNQVSRIDEQAFQDLAQLSVLQLNDNEISWTMEDVSGAFRGLDSLTKLGLRSNGIRSVAVPAFSGLLRLRQLNMEDNDFVSIQENAFETLRGLRDLRFNSSKLFCDCDLAWLPSWLVKQGFQHTALGTCFHPLPLRGVNIYQMDVKKLTCNDSQLPKPVILESPKSANGFKGGNLTLSCTVAITGKSQPNIYWKKDRMMLSDGKTEVRAESDGEVKRFTSYLHLVNIKDSMAGKYQCWVTNDFGSSSSQRAYVNVYVYPVFIKTPKDVTVKAGKSAELKCAATGQPRPVISWQKDGGENFPAANERRMRVYPNDYHFYIVKTRSADEGVYSCMATNDAGKVVANATLTVLETPDFVEPMPSKKRTRQGDTSVLQCIASGSPPPKLTWLKDNEPVEVTPRHRFTVDSQLLIIMDTQKSDAGLYACRMSNSLGTTKGSTELQVLSASGDSDGSGGGSSGLDDESTTTGIIIIAVVCCVVGTSLVWVIIIYQTRKRHEVYSTTPTDETTLPGEVQSSGYMSSDKEGSYSQGLMATPGYYYQDYQMKESGYESSSGQYRSNGHPRPLAAFAHDDEDDHNPPVVTAGDKLLQQIRHKEHSASSLHYPGSDDDDTIGSRHSSSSGHHSNSSNPPSSHSTQSGSNQHPPPQLHIFTNPLSADLYLHHPHPHHHHASSSHPSTPSPSSDEATSGGVNRQGGEGGGGVGGGGLHTSKSRLTPSPDLRPVLQTFHPTKPPAGHHSRSGSSGQLDPHQRERGGSDRGCDSASAFASLVNTKGGNGKYPPSHPRQRHYSDSCDNNRDADSSPAYNGAAALPCQGCLAAQRAAQAQQQALQDGQRPPHSGGGGVHPSETDNNNSGGNGSRRGSFSNHHHHHRNGDSAATTTTTANPYYYSSLPPSSHLSSTFCHRLRSGSHPRGRDPSPSPSSSHNNACTDCNCSCSNNNNNNDNKCIQQVAGGGGVGHPPNSIPPQPPLHSSSSNCTNQCLCHSGASKDQPPPNYDEVISHNRYNNHCAHHRQASSAVSSPSKTALSRSRSSSSVGRDPMYYAYYDGCDASPCCGTTSDNREPNCDDVSCTHSRCADCENSKKRKQPLSRSHHRQAKGSRGCSSPNYSPAACSTTTPLITPTEPSAPPQPSTIPSTSTLPK